MTSSKIITTLPKA